jgi:predicted Zn-ribbon and HTH transcriptional regulator
MTTLPDPDFTAEEIQAVMQKIAVAVKLLKSVCAIKDHVKKLKNHPIHNYTPFLSDLMWDDVLSKRQLAYLIVELKEYKEDFKRSKNTWVKQRTAMAVDLFQQMIDSNFEIPKQALDLLEELYPYPEVIQIELKTKKFNHTVQTNTTCPNCNHHFQANEIQEYVEVGYRCPQCRQSIRLS